MSTPSDRVVDSKSQEKPKFQQNVVVQRTPANVVRPSTSAKTGGGSELSASLSGNMEEDEDFVLVAEDAVALASAQAQAEQNYRGSAVDLKDGLAKNGQNGQSSAMEVTASQSSRFSRQTHMQELLPHMSEADQLAWVLAISRDSQPNKGQNPAVRGQALQQSSALLEARRVEQKIYVDDPNVDRKKNLDNSNPLTKEIAQMRARIVHVKETKLALEQQFSKDLENFAKRSKTFTDLSELNVRDLKKNIASAETILDTAIKSNNKDKIDKATRDVNTAKSGLTNYIKNRQSELIELNLMRQALEQSKTTIADYVAEVKKLDLTLERLKQKEAGTAESASRREPTAAAPRRESAERSKSKGPSIDDPLKAAMASLNEPLPTLFPVRNGDEDLGPQVPFDWQRKLRAKQNADDQKMKTDKKDKQSTKP